MPGKFIVGRFLDMPPIGFDNNPTLIEGANHFVSVVAPQYEIRESTGLIEKRSAVAAGTNVKTHRNFRWLPWKPGKITYVPLAGDDVFTGPMSGCWVVIFELNGARCIGHIGTSLDSAHPDSVQVKAGWRAAVNNGTVRPIAAFNPTAGDAVNYGASPTFYGLVTSTEEMYSVILSKPYKGGVLFKEKIEAVSLATSITEPPF